MANLCVCYIMTNQNTLAEELMKKIEDEEDRLESCEPDKKLYHLCIVNLVIGTLYCSKGNYEFGISRVIKSLQPYHKKLGTDTWYVDCTRLQSFSPKKFLNLSSTLLSGSMRKDAFCC